MDIFAVELLVLNQWMNDLCLVKVFIFPF